MPTYTYTDRSRHDTTIIHGMTEEPVITCDICGEAMHRRPQVVAVNWNGLPPHLADTRSAAVNAMINRELPEQQR